MKMIWVVGDGRTRTSFEEEAMGWIFRDLLVWFVLIPPCAFCLQTSIRIPSMQCAAYLFYICP